MTKDQRFIGTGVAIVTPFQNGHVDFTALEKIIEHVINGGVNYIVALGSTGEAATLDDAECRHILDFCIEKINNRVPLMAGNFGGNNTRELVSRIKNFDFSGIDAILSASPSYVKPSQEGIYQHYMAIAEVSPVPIMLYNVPGRTSSNMTWETTVRLAEKSEKFVGIKEASGDLVQVTHVIKNKPDHFIVTSGDDELTLPMMALGGDGVISVIANALPRQFSMMINAALDNDVYAAREINFLTFPLHKWLYTEGNPTGIKAAMNVLNLCSPEMRSPLLPMTEKNHDLMKKVLNDILQAI